ncbi:hypothetical protein F7725_009525 [Dissostichus mawsoni]|uniref:Uncharacterized protein n=1 Tax=Dissostichus mawsoni TaxID=36200 RepID=A0A7J5XMD5_DISMA|nr:hypothetical protein F7725_009525 [Dissostichus mawsoni]
MSNMKETVTTKPSNTSNLCWKNSRRFPNSSTMKNVSRARLRKWNTCKQVGQKQVFIRNTNVDQSVSHLWNKVVMFQLDHGQLYQQLGQNKDGIQDDQTHHHHLEEKSDHQYKSLCRDCLKESVVGNSPVAGLSSSLAACSSSSSSPATCGSSPTAVKKLRYRTMVEGVDRAQLRGTMERAFKSN